jgi:putative transposase
VFGYFSCWKRSGLIEKVHSFLRQQVRLKADRKSKPSAGIIDSQSVKSTECSDERGYDAGKKINGRKRHIVVDTMGLILMVMVLPASIQDRDGAKLLLDAVLARFGRLKLIWADGGYAGQLVGWVKETWRRTLEIVKRSDTAKGFKVLPRRWVVERTFGWLGRSRRLSKDYERQSTSGEAMIYLAMSRLMLKRLSK